MPQSYTINNVSDLREAVHGYEGLFDVWDNDVGTHLTITRATDAGVWFELGDTATDLQTIEDLLKAVTQFAGHVPIMVMKDSKRVDLAAIGPSGEDTDFSFQIQDRN